MPRDSVEAAKFLTPAQAARRAGCGRTRVSNALREGNLQGIRDNRGCWQIDPKDVDAWVATWRVAPGDTAASSRDSAVTLSQHQLSATLREDLAAARAEIQGLEARLKDRDREIERLDAALHAALAPRTSLLERLFPGRRRGMA